MTEPQPSDTQPVPGLFPRVPAYAWSWLQRSRPVLTEVSRRLDGGAAGSGFVETLRERFATDPFVRSVVVGAIADVAFKGRIPRRRPPGASWDRGLIWWAAAIAGTTPQQFDAVGPEVTQSRLFGVEETPDNRGGRRPRRRASGERAAVAAALRELLAAADGDQISAAAVRQLLDQLETPNSSEGTGQQ